MQFLVAIEGAIVAAMIGVSDIERRDLLSAGTERREDQTSGLYLKTTARANARANGAAHLALYAVDQSLVVQQRRPLCQRSVH